MLTEKINPSENPDAHQPMSLQVLPTGIGQLTRSSTINEKQIDFLQVTEEFVWF